MDESLRLNNDAYFGKDLQPVDARIHVLVVVPGSSALSQQLQRIAHQAVAWYGMHESL
ncbi:hypothetical protein Pcac1_g24043 [Phytophthora cactorum]|nr:hypothetical protein Pcac1_g24043 [Phytophthora cactorum]